MEYLFALAMLIWLMTIITIAWKMSQACKPTSNDVIGHVERVDQNEYGVEAIIKLNERGTKMIRRGNLRGLSLGPFNLGP